MCDAAQQIKNSILEHLDMTSTMHSVNKTWTHVFHRLLGNDTEELLEDDVGGATIKVWCLGMGAPGTTHQHVRDIVNVHRDLGGMCKAFGETPKACGHSGGGKTTVATIMTQVLDSTDGTLPSMEGEAAMSFSDFLHLVSGNDVDAGKFYTVGQGHYAQEMQIIQERLRGYLESHKPVTRSSILPIPLHQPGSSTTQASHGGGGAFM